MNQFDAPEFTALIDDLLADLEAQRAERVRAAESVTKDYKPKIVASVANRLRARYASKKGGA